MKLERWQNNRYVVLVLLCFLLIQTGCMTGLSDTAWLDYLILKVETDRSQAQVGVPIQIRFTVTNTGSRTYVLESNDKPVMDVTVRALGSDEDLKVWSWTPKEGDVSTGSRPIVGVDGFVYGPRPEIWQATGVSICASKCY